jgi:hypothetical protein
VRPSRRQHRHAVDLRQAEIQNDDVVRLGVAEEVGLLAVRGVIHGVSGVGQRRSELTGEVGVVLDEQHAHSAFSDHPAGAAVHKDIGDAAAGIFPSHHDHVAPVAGPEEAAGTAGRSALHGLGHAHAGALLHPLPQVGLFPAVGPLRALAVLRDRSHGSGGDEGGGEKG